MCLFRTNSVAGEVHDLIHRVLIEEHLIRERTRRLAARIEQDFSLSELTVIPILFGSFIFAADLIRNINLPVRLEVIRSSSYHGGTRPGKDPSLDIEPFPEIKDRNVLVIDDILDTGATLGRVRDELLRRRPAKLKLCTFLVKEKPAGSRKVDLAVDYFGFRVPDVFVVGYGLDYAGMFRNLPYVASLDESRI